MDNHHHHHFMLKVSRLFPSSLTSCQFRALPDVAESSITIPKTKAMPQLHQENDVLSPNFLKKPKKFHEKLLFPAKKNSGGLLSAAVSETEGRKCPPVTPVSNTAADSSKKKDRNFGGTSKKNSARCRSTVSVNLQSSSSNSGWFSSSDEKSRADSAETDAFFSLSSNSGDSFRLKTSRRFKRCEEMKSIDEMGRCSFSSSITSFDSVLSRKIPAKKTKERKTQIKSGRKWPEYELGSGQISAQIYYSNDRVDSRTSSRRRKTVRTRRKTADERSSSGRSSLKSSGIGESYAVEKSSSDPRRDFRSSMVEMIVEKQMFGREDLERLLHCFLSLNAASYHGIIVEVFTEICETLFKN